MNRSNILITKYFEENSFVNADIKSFNDFIDKELPRIIEENKDIEPTIIPPNVDEYKIKLDKIYVKAPEVTEADGSKKVIYPCEARLRKMTYAGQVFIEMSSHINGVQRETFKTQIGNIPIMLKSKFCHLNGLSRKELIEHGEDPDDPGGYFIINGSEKAIIKIEDLAPNKLLVEKMSIGVSTYTGKLFSERGSYKIPHTFEKLKDGIYYLTFTRVKRIPIVAIMKAMGVLKDEDIVKYIDLGDNSEVFINLLEFVDIKTEEDALDYIAKRIGITQAKEIRVARMQDVLDKYLFPHIGIEQEFRFLKSVNLAKYLK